MNSFVKTARDHIADLFGMELPPTKAIIALRDKSTGRIVRALEFHPGSEEYRSAPGLYDAWPAWGQSNSCFSPLHRRPANLRREFRQRFHVDLDSVSVEVEAPAPFGSVGRIEAEWRATRAPQ